MNLELSSKEKNLLQDQLKHEAICIQKYTNYSTQATDPELQQLFSYLASQEQTHYSTIETMLMGQQPKLNQQKPQGQSQSQQNQGQQSQQSMQSTQMNYEQGSMDNTIPSQGDATLCTDSVMTEQFVSGSYDTSIFESTNQTLTQALQHIQKEEQEHGQKLQQYMQNKSLQ